MTDARSKQALRLALAALYATAGIAHLARPELFLPIVPDWAPFPREVVLATGVAEIAGAVGLLTARFRRAAGIGLAVYAVCVFPANIKHAVEGVAVGGVQLSWGYHGAEAGAAAGAGVVGVVGWADVATATRRILLLYLNDRANHETDPMNLTLHDLPEDLVASLKHRAKRSGQTVEQEAIELLFDSIESRTADCGIEPAVRNCAVPALVGNRADCGGLERT